MMLLRALRRSQLPLLILSLMTAAQAEECWVDIWGFDGTAKLRKFSIEKMEVMMYRSLVEFDSIEVPFLLKEIQPGQIRVSIDKSMQEKFVRLYVEPRNTRGAGLTRVFFPRCGGILTLTPGDLQPDDGLDRSVWGVIHRRILGIRFEPSRLYVVKAVPVYGGKESFVVPEARVDGSGQFTLSGYLGEGRITLVLTEDGRTIGVRDLEYAEYKEATPRDVRFWKVGGG